MNFCFEILWFKISFKKWKKIQKNYFSRKKMRYCFLIRINNNISFHNNVYINITINKRFQLKIS